MLRIKLMRALLPMPLDDERRAGRMRSGAPQPEPTLLPSLRARHLTLSELDKQALIDLKSQIRRTGAVVYANYLVSLLASLLLPPLAEGIEA